MIVYQMTTMGRELYIYIRQQKNRPEKMEEVILLML